MARLTPYITLAALAAVLAPAADAQQRGRDREERFTTRLDTTFAFAARGSGEITVPGGDIIVRAWNEPRVRVRAAAERGDVRLEGSSGFFSLGLRGSYGRSTDARFEVTVPAGTRIRAVTQSGDISIVGTRGEVEASTQSGDVEVAEANERVAVNLLSGDVTMRRITGDVRVSAVSGDVELAESSGDVEIATVSGEIDLRGVTSRRVRAKSTSGDVSYDGSIDPSGRYDLGSHSGEVDVFLAQAVSAQITVSTYSGGIESDFPITLNPGDHNVGIGGTKRFTFNVGRGDARITAESFSGDVTIRQRGRAARDR
ncbi:MAG TPA: DUF4097 family beta strand repeat-containing protein [Gemmatimonadaceae bacterium]|nr:DUF4097 family beta strand repeat-containing protein [Gemmatimonadaceae bacterium]